MSLTLTNIPKIMRSKGWDVGARLMERWFAGVPSSAPKYVSPDTSTVTMNWILGFSRAKTVYDKLVKDQIWQNAAAQKEIVNMLRSKGLLSGTVAKSFGNFSAPVDQQHADNVNFRAFKDGDYDTNYLGAYYGYYSYYGYNTMDGLTAALGRFTFYALVSGTVTPVTSGGKTSYQISITEAAVYVRDSYDFEGFQPLGFWDDSDNSVSPTNFFSGTLVTNGSFRDWRKTNGRGGDYLIYTDLVRLPLARPFTFTAN
jgi:hypothetical protein